MFRELGDAVGTAWSLHQPGHRRASPGRRERAAALLTESLALAERIGFREGIAWSLEQLGLLAAVDGDPAASALLRRSLEIAQRSARPVADVQRARGPRRDRARPGQRAACGATARRGGGDARGDRHGDRSVRAPPARPRPPTRCGPRSATRRSPLHGSRACRPRSKTCRRTRPRPATAVGPGPSGQPAARTDPPAARAGSHRKPLADARKQDAGTTAASGMLRIRALGAATVHRGDAAVTAADWGYAKPRELLFLLASSPPMTRTSWAPRSGPTCHVSSSATRCTPRLRELRRALGDPGWVVYSDGHYRFDRSRTHECDVDAVRARAGRRRPGARPAEAALPDLQRAAAAYRGGLPGRDGRRRMGARRAATS